MSYRVSIPPQAASLLASAPPLVLDRVLRNLSDEDRERANTMKGTRTRVVFIFDEPMLSLEVGRYTVFYEVDPADRAVRVRHVTGPARVAGARADTRAPRSRRAPRSGHRSSDHRSSDHRSSDRRSLGGPSSC
jgi:hypothetical protein